MRPLCVLGIDQLLRAKLHEESKSVASSLMVYLKLVFLLIVRTKYSYVMVTLQNIVLARIIDLRDSDNAMDNNRNLNILCTSL